VATRNESLRSHEVPSSICNIGVTGAQPRDVSIGSNRLGEQDLASYFPDPVGATDHPRAGMERADWGWALFARILIWATRNAR
jgi:hypothetical protein